MTIIIRNVGSAVEDKPLTKNMANKYNTFRHGGTTAHSRDLEGGCRMDCVSVLVIEDSPLLLYGIRCYLETVAGFRVVSQTLAGGSLDAGASAVPETPDVVVIGAAGGETVAQSIVRQMKRSYPAAHLIGIVSSRDDDGIDVLLQTGFDGVLSDKAQGDELVRTIRAVLDGGLVIGSGFGKKLFPLARHKSRMQGTVAGLNTLTDRELDVVKAVSEGMTNSQIGERLRIGERTVRSHLTVIYLKLGVSNRTEAALMVLKTDQTGTHELQAGVDVASAQNGKEADILGCNEEGDSVVDLEHVQRHQHSEGVSEHDSLLEQINEGYWLIQDERFLMVNRTICDMLGCSQRDLLGRRSSEIAPPELRESLLQMHRRRLKGEPMPECYCLTLPKKDGSKIRLRFSVKVVSHNNRKAAAVIISRTNQTVVTESQLKLQLTTFLRSPLQTSGDDRAL